MAYRRSITSSHPSDNTPRCNTPKPSSSDSSVSFPSGCSGKYEWIWDSTRRAERLPQTPTPTESFEEESERHQAEEDWGEEQRDEEEDEEEYDELEWVGSRSARAIAPWTEGVGSTSIMVAQGELAATRLRIQELEGVVEEQVDGAVVVRNMNDELAERVADMSVGYVMMGMGNERAELTVKALWMGVACLCVLVVALLLRAK